MTRYAYSPAARSRPWPPTYHVSSLAASQALDVELEELEDWNCCGATTYLEGRRAARHALCARNLALAERGLDVVTACNACYKNLWTPHAALTHDPDLAEHVNYALEADDLHYDGKVEVGRIMNAFATPAMEGYAGFLMI